MSQFSENLHLSLIPLFMAYDESVIWTPHVNYHHVNTDYAMDIIDTVSTPQISIDSVLAIWPYELSRVLPEPNQVDSPRLQSLYHVGDKATIAQSTKYCSTALKNRLYSNE